MSLWCRIFHQPHWGPPDVIEDPRMCFVRITVRHCRKCERTWLTVWDTISRWAVVCVGKRAWLDKPAALEEKQ